MAAVYKYRVWCETEGDWAYVWSEDGTAYPTQCPNDTSHAIDASKSALVETMADNLVKIDGPSEADGRQVVVNAPMSKGMSTLFTGAGDDQALGNGEGPCLDLEFTGPDTKVATLSYNTPIELHDGQFCYGDAEAWTRSDKFDLYLRLPPTVVVANGSNAGNCNLFPLGGYNAIVPAAGDGAHDVDLAAAVPVPANGDGLWDCDYHSGVVTPSATPGTADFHLLDVEVKPHFMRKMPMCHPLGVLDVDTYKSEWVHQTWEICLEVVRVSAGAAWASGWLLTYRTDVT